MFTFRLKHEFQEHKLTFLIWLGTLILLISSSHIIWNRPLEFGSDQNVESFGFVFMGIITASIAHLHRVLGRDLYLQHTAFWNTRPIRGKTLFIVKWTYLQLTLTLPIMITMAFLAIIIGRPDQLVRGVLEFGTISLMTTSAFTYSALAIRAGRYLALFLFGVVLILPIIIIANLFSDFTNSQQDLGNQINWTPLFTLLFLTLGSIALLFFVVKKRHHAPPLLIIPLMALITLFLMIFQPLTWTSTDTIKLPLLEPQDSVIYSDKIRWRQQRRGNQKGFSFAQNIAMKQSKLNTIFNQRFPMKRSEFTSLYSSAIQLSNLTIEGLPKEIEDQVLITAETFHPGKTAYIDLKYTFLNNQPIERGNGLSDRGLPRVHSIQSIPIDTPITVKGTILILQNHYRDLVDSPVSSEHSQSETALRYLFRKDSHFSNNQLELKYQCGNLLTFFTPQNSLYSEIAVDIFHHSTGFNFIRNSSSSRDGLLGLSREHYYDSNEFTHKLKHLGFTMDQVIDESILKISIVDKKTYYEFPVEFKTTIPNPAKVIELID